MASAEDEEYHSVPYKSKPFTWGYGTSEYWKNVKVHPESGCSIISTDINHPNNNPCMKEQQLSLACREKGPMGDECQPYFENYRLCIKFWYQVMKERRIRGEMPVLPPPDLREQIKKEYMERNYTTS
ncbi:Coiled-coil-helix-coiled-coil-helix domain-containing protein 7 [Portunus trituberculatus]|uniref:Coiled-coil-helix-coiled-coil-helix domain-containing protein 7 n=1 Tax=Portunus trituberculatus TaxID=210409 RepID=A0A5B7GEV0_PORTR|nr:Coiled-coil-helix-coiled-coil-helix domain-containing protein 7 [Portunus trituberculatus]